MSDSYVAHSRLEELKRSFDQSFAEAPWRETEQAESFLSIRVGSQAYAVLLSQASGLYVDRKVVGLPGPVTELLGMAGFRGTVIPVFDLGACLGYGLSDAGRWMLLVGKNELIGLAFQEFDGYLRTPRDVARQESGEEMREHVSEVVVVGGIIRPVINLVSVVQALKRRVASVGSSEGA
jgi:purine-binding chemotaxis protein CheW